MYWYINFLRLCVLLNKVNKMIKFKWAKQNETSPRNTVTSFWRPFYILEELELEKYIPFCVYHLMDDFSTKPMSGLKGSQNLNKKRE